MSEKPIIFSAPMVRAVLDGRKTQTRRVIKNLDYVGGAGEENEPCSWGFADQYGDYHTLPCSCPPQFHQHKIACPYGARGSYLWVRETWRDAACIACDIGYPPARMVDCICGKPDAVVYRASTDAPERFGWKPSIHMPRWASRITLRITDVRVERVQETSKDDAEAEGVQALTDGFRYGHQYPVDMFRHLWDSNNAKRGYGWETNPWVWVISFEVD